ncbi:MAG TPA: MFS transporter [Actinomycetota bacterium]|nr:MFS transporter [Actinomycetota bacterium]
MSDAHAPVGTLRGNLRHLPRAAWFLIGGAFLNRFASFAVVFLVLYLTRLGTSIQNAGVAVAVWGAGEVLASVIGGHLADRVGRRDTIVLSMVASAAAMVVIAEVHSYAAIVPVAFVAGLSSEMYRPAGAALLADLVPAGQRVTAFAALRLAVNLSIAAGAAVAGFLANHAITWVFLSDAATSVLFVIVAVTTLPRGRRTAQADDTALRGYRNALRDRAFTLFLVASALAAFVYFQQQSTLPLHVRASGLSNADFGLLLSLNGILVVAFELPLSALTMRLPPRAMIALGFVLVGVGFGLTAVSHSLTALMATVAIWTLGEMIGAPIGYAYVADVAPENLRGRYQGLYGLCWSSGVVTGPAIGAMLFAWRPTSLWTICGLVGAVAALLVWSTRPGKARRRDLFPAAPHTGPGNKP